MVDVEYIKRKLQLEPLPMEGGYFRESYRSRTQLNGECLPGMYGAARSLSTGIYYLLTPDTFSALHRLPGDEIFHFYMGDPVEMLQLHPGGRTGRIVLGTDLEAGMRPQVAVPGGTWQGARLMSRGRFALLGTTMAPGFEFSDFIAGNRRELIDHYPDARELISALTHDEQ